MPFKVCETTGQALKVGDFVTIVQESAYKGRQGFVREILASHDFVWVDIDESPRDRRPASVGLYAEFLRKESSHAA